MSSRLNGTLVATNIKFYRDNRLKINDFLRLVASI